MNAMRTISLKVRFQDRAEAATCLRSLQQIPGTSVNLVRGRVTAAEADYDIEIKGRGRILEQAVWKALPSRALAERGEA